MNLLLNDRLAPITSTIGFLQTDLQNAVRGFIDWQEPIQNRRGVALTVRHIDGHLGSTLMALLPLTSVEARRFLLVPTNGTWVAYFDSGYRGTDAAGPMSYLARTLRCQGLRVVTVPHHQPKLEAGQWRGRYGATILDLFGPDVKNHSNTIRSIAMMNDGGRWVFDEIGDRLPFEETEAYMAKRIRDRFPVELLARYLNHLGLDPLDEQFYCPQAVLIEKKGPSAPAMKEYRFEEVRAML